MFAAEIHEYGEPDVFRLTTEREEPISAPGQVVVRTRATSVNPIDCRMRRGYGRVLFSMMRGGQEFPAVLGRDIAGEVVALGEGAARFQLGDRVFGAPNTGVQGTYAELMAVGESELAAIPAGIEFVDAASLAYVAATSWAAVVTHGGLTVDTAPAKRVLVVAGAGGTGSFAVQWLKAWGCHVAATASAKNQELVEEFGADEVIDYTTTDFADVLRDYDLVYDNLGTDEDHAVRTCKQDGTARFVTIVHPFLSTIDELGMEKGMPAANAEQEQRRAKFATLGGYAWSVAQPTGAGMAEIARLAGAGKIRPHVTDTYPLERVAAAHARLEAGHVPGKLVLTLDD